MNGFCIFLLWNGLASGSSQYPSETFFKSLRCIHFWIELRLEQRIFEQTKELTVIKSFFSSVRKIFTPE
jgi:hypothetical protein